MINIFDKLHKMLFPKLYEKKMQQQYQKTEVAIANHYNRIRTDTVTDLSDTKDPKIPTRRNMAIFRDLYTVEIIDANPNVFLVHMAAKLSRGEKMLSTYEERLNHIQRIMKRGHESILEHSNIVALIKIPYDTICMFGCDVTIDLMDILAKSRYLHIATSKKNNVLHILIGGSIRGYLNTVREVSPYNSLIEEMFNKIIYQSIEKEFLYDLLNKGLLKESECNYKAKAKLSEVTNKNEHGEDITEAVASDLPDPSPLYEKNVDLIYAEDYWSIWDKIKKYGFNLHDALRMGTITFKFDNVSRAIGNQLVRHRVGITQISQRYVKQTARTFINPIDLKHQFTNIYSDEQFETIQKYLSKKQLYQIYHNLLDKGVSKEDARYYLPLGTPTTILMTFTYKQFAKFLELRTSKEAQLEIRCLANQTQNLFYERFQEHLYENHLNRIRDSEKIKDIVTHSLISVALSYESLSNFNTELDDNFIKIDEETDNISTEIKEVVPTKAEDIKSLDIDTLEDAESYLKQSEELSNLRED